MLTSIEIVNYKSIEKLTLPLGRFNVLIGENGAGKSNLLEAIALAGAASAGKLDNEFLASRGIRVTSPQLMRGGFAIENSVEPVRVGIVGTDRSKTSFALTHDNGPYSQWQLMIEEAPYIAAAIPTFIEAIEIAAKYNHTLSKNRPEWFQIIDFALARKATKDFNSFIIYSPENTSLRTFEREGQIEPLGINGEGLLKLLTVLSEPEYAESLKVIKDGLKLFGWFQDFEIDGPQVDGIPRRLSILDRYLTNGVAKFDQKSANEGFLFVTFYLALFATDLTPKFFAIDNIDASLNPKMCEKLVRELVRLAALRDKQVIITTHNPAVLDGLNLDDDDQRLFVVSRNSDGHTRIRRIQKPRQAEGQPPIRLSEAFIRGTLGGLPKGF